MRASAAMVKIGSREFLALFFVGMLVSRIRLRGVAGDS
jgi:hypothetical protein